MADPTGTPDYFKTAETMDKVSVAASDSDEATEPAGHQPYVPDATRMPEFTWQAVIVGTLLGLVFGASSLYLVLKVGITVSASIPVAVLAITLFRGLANAFGLRRTSILENNIIQTAGSAGESIAFGVGVTMPALMLIGFEMEWSRVLVVSTLGGLLGILMMIPLRRAFIVNMHGKPGEPGKLLYPEGTACAQVLISGEKGGMSGKTVFIGFGLAFAHKIITEGMNLLKTTLALPMPWFSRVARVTGDMATELLGVGYIIGVSTSSVMMAGAVLGFLVIIPAVALTAPESLSAKDIYNDYLKTIGAGCVAAAGIISMGRTLPMIVRSFGAGLRGMRGGTAARSVRSTRRTDNDLPPSFVLGGSLILLALLAAFLAKEVGPVNSVLGAILVLLFGFLFVTVSSRLTGEIGSSSNPISGMTVATLLLTCLIFLTLRMTTPTDAVLALSIGGVVCIAASNGGTTSQDLKTGYLLGATPRWQQWAILVGALTSAIIIGGTLLLFNRVGTVYSQRVPAVNVKSQLAEIKEKEEYNGETFYVWRPNREEELPSAVEPGKKVKVKPGKYFVDDTGRVRYYIDPTITGNLKTRDSYEPYKGKAVTLKPDELKRLNTTVLLKSEKGDTYYRLWTNKKPEVEEGGSVDESEKAKKEEETEPYFSSLEEGDYLVDASGHVAFTVVGKPVGLKFEAPKTQVMGIIINGLLNKNLKWGLVLIGAFIAITLELCGISSLAFAVGVYIPMQYSTPIFLGGLARWGVDVWTTRRTGPTGGPTDEAAEIAKSESSPGVLLASGLIAGGSLGGVLLAFLQFDESLTKAIDFEKPAAALLGTGLGADMVALIVFLALAGMLLMAGVGMIFRPKDEEQATENNGRSPTI